MWHQSHKAIGDHSGLMRRAWSFLSMLLHPEFLFRKEEKTKALSKILPQFLPANHLDSHSEKCQARRSHGLQKQKFTGRCCVESGRLDALICSHCRSLHSLLLWFIRTAFLHNPWGKKKYPQHPHHKIDLSQNPVLLPTIFRPEHIFLWLLVKRCTETASSFLTSLFLFRPSRV